MCILRLVKFGLCFGITVGLAGAAHAQSTDKPNATLNQCWGNVASQLAQLGKNDDISGGGMGAHSRSAKSPQGGFAAGSGLIEEPRNGVGNQSQNPPHSTHPSEGGNGIHANNNAIFTNPNRPGFSLDPVTGEAATAANTLEPCF